MRKLSLSEPWNLRGRDKTNTRATVQRMPLVSIARLCVSESELSTGRIRQKWPVDNSESMLIIMGFQSDQWITFNVSHSDIEEGPDHHIWI